MIDEKKLKQKMLEDSEEFQKTFALHQECEKKLENLNQKNFLTEGEELEEKALKKKKLFLKDKMYFLMSEYKKTQK